MSHQLKNKFVLLSVSQKVFWTDQLKAQDFISFKSRNDTEGINSLRTTENHAGGKTKVEGVSLELQRVLAGKYYEASQNLVFRNKRWYLVAEIIQIRVSVTWFPSAEQKANTRKEERWWIL